jgi:hypothetical protein
MRAQRKIDSPAPLAAGGQQIGGEYALQGV